MRVAKIIAGILFINILIFLTSNNAWGAERDNTTLFLPLLNQKSLSVDHLMINEVMASNGTVNYDPASTNFDDWIELYNPTAQDIDLSGYFLSDDPDNLKAWTFPAGLVIPADGYILVWASDGNPADNLYTGFKLSDKGETLILSNQQARVIDRVTFGKQSHDVSFGRFAERPTQWGYFGAPSPLTANQNGVTHDQRTAEPTLKRDGGFYNGDQWLKMEYESRTKIYYTTDGTTPTENSAVYDQAVYMPKNTVVKAMAVKRGYLPSNIVMATYFIDQPASTLPVVSIGVNPDYLWDETIGIYVKGTNGVAGPCTAEPHNWHRDWERPVTIELYEPDGTLGFAMNAGAKIFGGCTRSKLQKSLAIHLRDEYGDDMLNYPIFQDGLVEKHHAFLLRNSGNDWVETMMRDAVAQSVLAQETDWDGQRTRPAILYINGTYWGIHNIRDKLNEDYLEEKHGVDRKQVDMLEGAGADVVEGSSTHYDALIDLVTTQDPMDAAVYATVQSWIDVDQYIDYQIGEIHLGNQDWPLKNIKFWRPQTDDGRWRWLTYDLDNTLGHEWLVPDYNALGAALGSFSTEHNPPESILLFKRLMRNSTFQSDFIQRFSVYLDTIFTGDRVTEIIETHEQTIRGEMGRHIGRWQFSPVSIPDWNNRVARFKENAQKRPDVMRDQLEAQFALPHAPVPISVQTDSTMGTVELNTIQVMSYTSPVHIYPNFPVTLAAMPKDGFQFVGWSGYGIDAESVDPSPAPTMTVRLPATLTETAVIKAIFEPIPVVTDTHIIINEIHYNPSTDLQGEDEIFEFIELYNPHDEPIDLSGYAITDGVVYTFPMTITQGSLTIGTIIPAKGYIVLANTADTYADLAVLVVQWESGGLKNSGERLVLSNPEGAIVDEVIYSDEDPWVIEPDGEGPSLSLIAPDFDNTLGENWEASPLVGGTPGAEN